MGSHRRLAGYPQRIRDSVVATLLAEDAAYSYSDSRTSHDHEPPTSNGNLHRLKFLLDQLSEEDRFLAQATISPTVFSSDRKTIELIRKMRTLPFDLRERIASAELCPLWLKTLRRVH